MIRPWMTMRSRQELAAAEEHVAICDRNVSSQRAIIEELERGGHDVRASRLLLRELEDTRQLCIMDRDRLLKEVIRE
jgi:hypothetical protein